MWKLSIEDDQGSKTVVNLVREEYSLGRAEENNIRLTERNISRKHARLWRSGKHWHLEDVGSYNGVVVNGIKLERDQVLQHGDFVQIGDYRLELVDEAALANEHSQSDSRVATVPNMPRRDTLVGQTDRLIMLVGPTPNVEFTLSQERAVLGRGEECDISINHASVSRVHADIQPLGDGRYEIIDRDSANGVRINGVELKRALIDARDNVELGDVVLKFIRAGDIYVPGADESQRLGALELSSASATAPPTALDKGSRGVLPKAVKVAAIVGTVAGVLAIGLMVLGRVRNDSPPAAVALASETVAPPEPEGSLAILAEAEALLEAKNYEGAHLKLAQELGANDALRHSQRVARIEAAWADHLFDQASRSEELSERRSILDRIAKSPTVDSARRKSAADALAKLDMEGIDIDELPETTEPVPKEAPRTKLARANASASRKLARPAPSSHNPYSAKPESSAGASKTAPDPRDLVTSGDYTKLEQAKALLKSKVSTGTATDQDKRMLRALCRQLGDMTCSQ